MVWTNFLSLKLCLFELSQYRYGPYLATKFKYNLMLLNDSQNIFVFDFLNSILSTFYWAFLSASLSFLVARDIRTWIYLRCILLRAVFGSLSKFLKMMFKLCICSVRDWIICKLSGFRVLSPDIVQPASAMAFDRRCPSLRRHCGGQKHCHWGDFRLLTPVWRRAPG